VAQRYERGLGAGKLREDGGGLTISAEDVCCEDYQRKTEEWDERGDLERSLTA
jgi:hypothetical protein